MARRRRDAAPGGREREEAEPHVRARAREGNRGSSGRVAPPTSRHFSPLVPSVNYGRRRVTARVTAGAGIRVTRGVSAGWGMPV
ncbi:hypothetical protein GCM10009863_11280 [Streptomyces axinellae]|uniref:Uncharacterized protein n=1 Tax=Streptomyces axinellae TaxID=552788 RepID=A0ABN3PWR5_9ACTN